MQIQFASDLHLELKENLACVQSIPFEVTGEILIFAGDTFYLKDNTEIENTKIISNQLEYLLNGWQADGFSESRFIEL